ncbi:MAG: ThiF family adenylyltransferase [Kofleriaceae bacterium]|nr:ThiF family adenylyltransferase [Kofleriaceae bacterium]
MSAPASPTIAVVGAGGLGGPLVWALTAAGARVVVCDPDVVELSNLQRQVQFATADVGRAKAAALADEAARRGVADRVRAIAARFDATTADAIAGAADVVVDGSDSPATKLLVGDWAIARGRRHVVAGVLRWGGTVFSGAPGAACFRCLFEDEPDDAPSCADAGVVGAACAVIGGLAARAALALARGDAGDAGSILVVEDLRRPWAPRRARFGRRSGCRTCFPQVATDAHPS